MGPLRPGEFPRSLEQSRAILDLLEGPRAVERLALSGLPYCGACGIAVWSLLETGDLEGAVAFLDRADRVAAATGHLYSTVPLATVRGRVLIERGRIPDALRTLEPAVAVCRDKTFVGQLTLALVSLSRAYSLLGRHEDVIAAGREGVRIKDEAGAPVLRSHHVGAVAEASLAAGRLDEADAADLDALECAVRLQEPPWGDAQWILGAIAARRDQRQAEARHFGQGLAVARELGMRPLAERCEQSLAVLC